MIAFSWVTEPLAVADLAPGEAQQFADRFQNPDSLRAKEWLLGRAALRDVQRQLGEQQDTSKLEFPNTRYSVSHCEGHAVAVGLHASGSLTMAQGIGIDLERFRPLPKRAEHYYLQPQESELLTGLPADQQLPERIRLWCAKEALFKADPQNNKTRTMKAYRLQNPLSDCMQATGPNHQAYWVTTCQMEDWFMAIAHA